MNKGDVVMVLWHSRQESLGIISELGNETAIVSTFSPITGNWGAYTFNLKNIRELVVLDPMNSDTAPAVIKALINATTDPAIKAYLPEMPFSTVLAALNSLAKQSKPVEPSGKYPVVKDREGAEWVRRDETLWVLIKPSLGNSTAGQLRRYEHIDAEEVIFEGVPE